MDRVALRVVGDVPAQALLDLDVVCGQRSLDQVVAWALAQPAAKLISQVVKQDEFTQDVVLPVRERAFLVYDTT